MPSQLFSSAELSPGEMRAVESDGTRLVIIRTSDGGLFALRDTCSHYGAPLSKGVLERKVIGDVPGTYELGDTYIVRCPWHRFEFDVETGECPLDRRQRVRAYRVAERDGYVYLED